MNKRFFLIILLFTTITATAQENNPYNSYYMLAESANGEKQSPINIPGFIVKNKEIDIERVYLSSKLSVSFENDIIQINYDFGSSIILENQLFDLKYIRFKSPAEHLISSVTYPLEMQIFHLSRTTGDQKMIIISYLFEEGRENEILKVVIDNIPSREETFKDESMIFDAEDFFENDKNYYFYEGSLTEAPFSENAYWLVKTDILEASYAQIKKINALQKNNARHIQALNGREITIITGL